MIFTIIFVSLSQALYKGHADIKKQNVTVTIREEYKSRGKEKIESKKTLLIPFPRQTEGGD
jgi:hypothetical protein